MDEYQIILRRAQFEIKVRLAMQPAQQEYAEQYWKYLMALRSEPADTDLTPQQTADLRDFVDDLMQLPHICREAGIGRSKDK